MRGDIARRGQPVHGRAGEAHRSCRENSRLLEQLVDAGAEPFEAVRLSRLHKTGTDDQHVVVPLRHALEALEPDLAQASLDPISRDCTADRTRHGKPDARLPRLLLRQPVENEGARGNRAAAAMHRIEVPGTGQAVGAPLRSSPGAPVPPTRPPETSARPLAPAPVTNV